MQGRIRTDSIQVDSIHVLVKHYNACDKLQREVQYLKVADDSFLRDGRQVQYYENGNINVSAYFKKGLQDSTTTFYYSNGNKRAHQYYYKGNCYGKSIEYDSSGRPQKIFYNVDDDKILLSINLDTRGNIDSLKGELIYPLALGNNKRFIAGDKISLGVVVPEYETTSTILKMKFLHNNQTVTDTLVNKFDQIINSSMFIYNIDKAQAGKYRFDLWAGLYDRKSGKLLKESKTSLTYIIAKR